MEHYSLSAPFEPVFENTLKKEGGFQSFPEDTANYCGGQLIGTKYGISAIGYKGFHGVCPTQEQIKALTQNDAFKIFKRKYWDRINGDKINNASVAAMMFQYIIGSGASQLSDIKAIANATAGKKLIAEVDTDITNEEAKIINSLPQRKFWDNLVSWRKEFYTRLVKKQPEKAKFLQGWLNRLNSYKFEDTGSGNLVGTLLPKTKKKRKILLIAGGSLLLLAAGGYVYKKYYK